VLAEDLAEALAKAVEEEGVMTTKQMQALQREVFAPLDPRKAVSGWLADGPVMGESERETVAKYIQVRQEMKQRGLMAPGWSTDFKAHERGRTVSVPREDRRGA